jgi:hypothetical protein
MNTRIKELAEQCWDHRPEGQLHFDNEKFADMIVKECIAQCESQNTVITTDIGTEAWGEISDAVEQIKRHFYGVAE